MSEDRPSPALSASVEHDSALPNPSSILARLVDQMNWGDEASSLLSEVIKDPEQERRLNAAYEDYERRLLAGEPVDLKAYCAGHPGLEVPLRRLIDAHRFLEGSARLPAEKPTSEEPEAWPEVGQSFLGFTLIGELGQGAFARVYLAREPRLGNRLVAIKVARHVFGEAETLGPLDHANIVGVHSVQHDPVRGLTAICMPYVGRATLHDVLVRCRQARSGTAILEAARAAVPDIQEPADRFLQRASYIDAVVYLAAQLADALAFVHARGIYHRDLKPSNVLLSPGGRPRLLDFNLSAAEERPDSPLGGTLTYMSPEQIRATVGKQAADLDARSDIYSLGVMLYELLAGAHPFGRVPSVARPRVSGARLLERQREGPPRCPGADVALNRLVMRCLAFDRAERPASAAEVAAALRATLTPLARLRRTARRHPLQAFCCVLLLFTALPLGGAAVVRGQLERHQRQFEEGMQAYQNGDFEVAIDCFTRAMDSGHDQAECFFARGRAYQQLQKPKSALGDLERLGGNAGERARVLACMGYSSSRAPYQRGAYSYYDQALAAQYAKPAVLWNNQALCCLQTPTLGDPQELLDKAIELDPALQPAYHNRAMMWYTRATAKLEAAGKKKSPPPMVLNPIRAMVQDALRDFEQAIRLGPRSADLYRDAARCYCLAAAVADNKDHWKRLALDAVAEALKLGQDPEQLARDMGLTILRGEKQFAEFLAQPRVASPNTVRAVRCIDPDPVLPRLALRGR